MLRLSRVAPDIKIHLSEQRLAISEETEQRVRDIWEKEKAKRSSLFDGDAIVVSKIEGNTIHAVKVQYRYLIAQRQGRELSAQLGFHFLSVSGILRCRDGYVFGKRAANVTLYPEWWEFVPSGGLEDESYREQILLELQEEVGIYEDKVTAMKPLFLVEDPGLTVIDLVVAINVDMNASEVLACYSEKASREYDPLEVVPKLELMNYLKNNQRQIIDISAMLIEKILAGECEI